MKKILTIQLLFTLSFLLSMSACEKKTCDCSGILGSKLQVKVDNSSLGDCTVIEDFQLNADSTINIYRYYKDSDGNQRESEIFSVASWALLNSNCSYKIHNLSGESYSFPSVETDCKGTVNKDNTFFYNLQFQESITLEISDITCGSIRVNDKEFSW